jgi:hypothetical protein
LIDGCHVHHNEGPAFPSSQSRIPKNAIQKAKGAALSRGFLKNNEHLPSALPA